jgi:hypothetical protein
MPGARRSVDPLVPSGPHPPPTTNNSAKTIARYGRVDLLCIDEIGNPFVCQDTSLGGFRGARTADRPCVRGDWCTLE